MLTCKKYSSFWILALAGAGAIALGGGGALEVKAQIISPADLEQVGQTDSSNHTFAIVNPATGNDATADGSDRAPFKTITKALQQAQPNTIVLLTPGVYSADTGEIFPLVLKSGVTVHGNPQTRGQGILIRGSGSFLSQTSARQNVTILGATQAALVGVTVTNPENAGYGLWVESTRPIVTDNTFTASGHDGISVVGDGAPLIRNNYFYQNGANGITIYGRSRPQVQENIFENTGFGITVNQFAAPMIEGNRITQNKDGVVVGANARPVLRNNSIEGNTRDGLVTIAQAQPDLGTATQPGGNVFRNNGQLDINAKQSSQMILAVGNEVAKTQGRLDLTGTQSTALVNGSASSSIAAAFPAAKAISPGIPAPPADPIPAASDVSASSFPVPAALNPSASAEPTPLAFAAQVKRTALPIALAIPKISAAPIASSPRPEVTAAPIAIPVPPPAAPPKRWTGRSLLLVTRTQLAPAASSALPVAPAIAPTQPDLVVEQRQGSAIVIPVPPPERRTIAAISPTPTTLPARQPGLPPTQPARLALSSVAAGTNLLPVPSAPIPIGNVGSGSGVALYQNVGQRNPVRSAASGSLPYRVVADVREQTKAQALVPGAFRTSLKGKTVVQLGAFGDRGKANELVQSLKGQGLQAAIEVE